MLLRINYLNKRITSLRSVCRIFLSKQSSRIRRYETFLKPKIQNTYNIRSKLTIDPSG